jgi:hypothetical protein
MVKIKLDEICPLEYIVIESNIKEMKDDQMEMPRLRSRVLPASGCPPLRDRP